MPIKRWVLTALVLLSTLGGAHAQIITKLTVEIKTKDKMFAGTDDPIHLLIGGHDLHLDDPDRDDFERNNLDRFEKDIPGIGLDLGLLRRMGTISVIKTKDSFWGGGWDFKGMTIWGHGPDPIYENPDIDVSLDGDHLEWHTTLGEPGWNLPPEPLPWPPCLTGDIDLGILIDSDCDGIADESDPSPFDTPVDSDGDCLPDLFEEQRGMDPNDPDSDDDGWLDGCNRRSYLVLTKVECLDEREDWGRDEIYLVTEDVRAPMSVDLDNTWVMDDDTEVFPFTIVDFRAAPPAAPGDPALNYTSHVRLREQDPTFLRRPTDDTYKKFTVTWSENSAITEVHQDDDSHYIMTFQSYTTTFLDPSPLDKDGDADEDKLADSLEFMISVQDPRVQPMNIAGYNGLADPESREMFIELDHAGADHRIKFTAKQMVGSQFYYHNVRPRFDDGYLGGGTELPYEEYVTMDELTDNYYNDSTIFAPERRQFYRYALFVDKIDGWFIFATNGLARGKRIVVARQTLTGLFGPIVYMHELGHTLELCHTDQWMADPPVTSETCPIPSGNKWCREYCGVPKDADTAMGDTVGLDSILAGALGLALIGAIIGGALFGLPGALIGAGIGLVVGGVAGFFNSDAYQRLVNYHDIEWENIKIWLRITSTP